MRIVIHASPERVAAAAAAHIAGLLRATPDLVLGLPTGRTTTPLYRALVRLHQAGRADFARAATFNLDEFLGVGPRDAGSYAAFMRAHLFDHVNLPRHRRHLLNGRARDPVREAARFEKRLEALGGLDVALIGIGANGHIAFNEPARTLAARTHPVRLSASTRRANAHLFGDRPERVPPRALTMGVGTLLHARQVVLIATGSGKAAILRRAVAGPVTTSVPASLLQLHPDAVVLADRDAARELSPTRRSPSRARRG
jgi:glucosamine-6-phosphate deaminase